MSRTHNASCHNHYCSMNILNKNMSGKLNIASMVSGYLRPFRDFYACIRKVSIFYKMMYYIYSVSNATIKDTNNHIE